MLSGVIEYFDVDRGDGHLLGADGHRYYFHCVNIADGTRTIEVGSRARGVRSVGRRGRDEVVQVAVKEIANRFDLKTANASIELMVKEKKLIVRASAFVRMHVWCHHAVCSSGVEGKSSVLGLLHFHDTGSRRRLERAIPVVHAYRFVDFARSTPSEQLRVAAARHATGPTCGHKLGYLLEHLRRREAIKAFRRHLGRLPSSPGEMDRPPSSFEHGWDDLVFAEAAQEHQLSARQVANALASLDIVVECEGTAAV